MRIGLAQMDIAWEKIEENERKARLFLEKAVHNQVELLIFPEMTLTGFSMNVEGLRPRMAEPLDFFREMSREYPLAIAFGDVEPVSEEEKRRRPDGKPYYNRFVVVEGGELLSSYYKLHPFTFGQEGEYFQPGEELGSFRWKETGIGTFVCYDLRFPEIFQISSRENQLLLVIANWPVSRIDSWDSLLKARAIETQSYIAGVNRVGEGGGLAYNGHSVVYGPRGERLTTFSEKESLLIADISAAEAERARRKFPVKKDRRPELYKKWL